MSSLFTDFTVDRKRFLTVITAVKYICSAILALLAVGGSGESGGLVAAYAELAAIFCVSNLIHMKWKKAGYIAGGILLLLFNSQMGPKEIKQYCQLDREAEALLDKAYQTYNMTARGYNKTLKVARTIADLSGMEKIQKEHIMEALTYRNAFVERL